MICSMTAFGRTQKEDAGYSVTLEIRALNGRSLDVVTRLPKNFLEFEELLRKQVARVMRRGRVEIFAQVETTNIEQKAPHFNMSLARFYWAQLQELHRRLPGSDPPKLSDLLSVPHLLAPPDAPADRDAIQKLLVDALSEALDQVNAMKCQEGEALLLDFHERLDNIRRDLAFIDGRKALIVDEYKTRLREKIQDLLGETQLDEYRLLQEVACSAERGDINEEIVRLNSHLDQMEALLSAQDAADGRRLDFLVQEMHREVNTIGCKTGDLEAVQAVVRMKSEIGKLKEQVQNVE